MKLLLCSCLLLAMAKSEPLKHGDFQTLIDEVNESSAKWKAGHNFDPLTPVHTLRRMVAAKTPLETPPKKEPLPDVVIPEEFDARTQWPSCPYIGQILEQGPCNSAWAIAATSAFSDRYCIATNGTFTLPLSAQELLSCCTDCGFGCGGGYQKKAWDYFKTNGIVTGGPYNSNIGCQPYQLHNNSSSQLFPTLPDSDTPTCKKNCTNLSYNVSFEKDHRKAKDAYSLYRNVTEIQKDIMLHGPVESTFDIYTDFMAYKSGVYHHVSGHFLGELSVKVFGWGVENATAYWLASTSWKETWGDKGIFKILRGQNECGFEDQMVAALPAL